MNELPKILDGQDRVEAKQRIERGGRVLARAMRRIAREQANDGKRCPDCGGALVQGEYVDRCPTCGTSVVRKNGDA